MLNNKQLNIIEHIKKTYGSDDKTIIGYCRKKILLSHKKRGKNGGVGRRKYSKMFYLQIAREFLCKVG